MSTDVIVIRVDDTLASPFPFIYLFVFHIIKSWHDLCIAPR